MRGERGAKIVVEHSEVLDKEGRFYNQNLRSAKAQLEYILKGEGEESYRPFFTFQGFRYARVTIWGKAELLGIESVPITSALKPAATFTSASALVNRLVQNTIWSQRANFIEVPTDCPQRDERLGWTGDAQVFAPTACYLNDSHDILVKWLRDVMADQRPDGGIAHVSPTRSAIWTRCISTARPAGAMPSASCPGYSTSTTAIGRSSRRRSRQCCAGTISSGRSATDPSSVRPRTGPAAGSPSATGCSLRTTSSRPCPPSVTMRRRPSTSTFRPP